MIKKIKPKSNGVVHQEATGISGVTPHFNKYQVRLRVGKENLHLGLYDDLKEATDVITLAKTYKSIYKRKIEKQLKKKGLLKLTEQQKCAMNINIKHNIKKIIEKNFNEVQGDT